MRGASTGCTRSVNAATDATVTLSPRAYLATAPPYSADAQHPVFTMSSKTISPSGTLTIGPEPLALAASSQ